MIPIRTLAVVAAITSVTACQAEEIAAICTTLGTAETGLSVEVQYPDGTQISAISNPADGQVSVTHQVYEADMVRVLGEAALAALDAAVPGGSVSCEGTRSSSLTVLFDGGAARSVTGTCPASPIDIYNEALFATFATERVQLSHERQMQTLELTSAEAACAHDWRAAF